MQIDRHELRRWALRFDWKKMAPTYDIALAGMV
jgi:hypothetical protein